MSFKIDTREFSSALRFVEQATGKDGTLLLNRAALHAVIGGKGVKGAMQRTPKASKSKIQSVPIEALSAGVAVRNRKRGVKMTSAQFADAVKSERARRKRSSGYTAYPGWSKAAQAFGGRGIKGVQGGFGKSQARKGYGTKAKGFNPTAEIANTAPAIEAIGKPALQAALNDVARDLVEYGTRKIQQTLNKVKAK